MVSTLAGTAGISGADDGTSPTARFFSPNAIAVDSLGDVIVADTSNHTIRKITPAGVVSTLAGAAGKVGIALGPLPSTLSSPYGIATRGNDVFITS